MKIINAIGFSALIFAIPASFMFPASKIALFIFIAVVLLALIFIVAFEESTGRKTYININNPTMQLTMLITSTVASGIGIGKVFKNGVDYTDGLIFFVSFVLTALAIAALVDDNFDEVGKDTGSMRQGIFWRRFFAFSFFLILNLFIVFLVAFSFYKIN